MLGSYTAGQGSLVFHPKYPPAPGVSVRAVFQAPAKPAIEARFIEPKPPLEPSARVEQVYPSGNRLPDNLLKFYIQFSAPMSRGEVWKRIRLLDESGAPVEAPFLYMVEELWDPDYRRLTLLFDPGRIKRGLARREQMGPALVEGKQYSLAIDRDFQDARGVPMRDEFRKQFVVASSDRTTPETANWLIRAPKAQTGEPLVVDFGEPMDWGMLQRALTVRGAGGIVAGTVSVAREESEWRFFPNGRWEPGQYQLLVDTSFEDLAGNHIGRLFDVDLDRFESISEHIEQKTSTIEFQVRGE
jgi:hypothetical protein